MGAPWALAARISAADLPLGGAPEVVADKGVDDEVGRREAHVLGSHFHRHAELLKDGEWLPGISPNRSVSELATPAR